ncbi:peptidase M20 [alpha proteobacterium AAP81b]|nr:peptidase M20 [alpha proteobacterium AAP81b]
MILRPLAIAALVAVPATAQPAPPAPGGDLVALYKDLHRNPELSLQEVRTSAILAGEARAAGFTVTEQVGGTGVVAVLKNGAGPTVLVRTDMDGLPVKEATGLAFASAAMGKASDGSATPVMHACGHDLHMTVWTGVARQLAATRATWSGTVVMIAQPAEEISKGAAAMLADGLYTRFPKPQFTLALHDDNRIPAGQVSVPARAALSISNSVDIVVRGVSGHGAYPQTTRDPVALAARIVMGLQTIVARENDPFKPAVVTVGSIHGGTKHNIIPDEVRLQLTVRSYDKAQQARLLAAIARVAKGEAIAAGMPDALLPIVTGNEGTQPTLNSPELAARVTTLFETRFGKDRVVTLDPSMASEDFYAFGAADPAIQTVIFWLGAAPHDAFAAAAAGGAPVPSLHNSGWAPEAPLAITTGVEAMTAAVTMLLPKR